MFQPSSSEAPSPRPSFSNYLFKEHLQPLSEGLLVCLLIVTFIFTTVGVIGQSDEPNLQTWDRVFVPKYQTWLNRFHLSNYQRGDLVVVKPNANSPEAVQPFPFIGKFGFTFKPYFIKRLVGLPGDTLSMDGGILYINGRRIDETHTVPYWMAKGNLDQNGPRANSSQWDYREVGASSKYVIPAGLYFVIGDNRSPGGSEDSRGFGPVPLEQIGGKATTVIWPPIKKDAEGKWKLYWRILKRPTAFDNIPAPSPKP